MDRVRSGRRAALAWAALLCLSLVAPAGQALAQDSPESAVNAVLDAIEAREFEAIADLVCEDQRAATRESFDIAADFGELPGVDPQAFLDAITISVAERQLDVIEQDDDSAVVVLDAVVDVTLDESMARQFVALMLGSLGDEVSDEDVDLFTEMMLSEMETASPISTRVAVVRVDDRWWACDDLSDLLQGSDPENGTAPDGGAAASADSLCGLLSIEELNALGPLQYVQTDASMAPSCMYAGDLQTSGHAISVDVDSYSTFDSLAEMFSDVFEMEEMDVAGYRAMWMPELNTLYVDSGAGIVMVNIFTGGSADLAAGDVPAYVVSVAETVVPRYLSAQD